MKSSIFNLIVFVSFVFLSTKFKLYFVRTPEQTQTQGGWLKAIFTESMVDERSGGRWRGVVSGKRRW